MGCCIFIILLFFWGTNLYAFNYEQDDMPYKPFSYNQLNEPFRSFGDRPNVWDGIGDMRGGFDRPDIPDGIGITPVEENLLFLFFLAIAYGLWARHRIYKNQLKK